MVDLEQNVAAALEGWGTPFQLNGGEGARCPKGQAPCVYCGLWISTSEEMPRTWGEVPAMTSGVPPISATASPARTQVRCREEGMCAVMGARKRGFEKGFFALATMLSPSRSHHVIEGHQSLIQFSPEGMFYADTSHLHEGKVNQPMKAIYVSAKHAHALVLATFLTETYGGGAEALVRLFRCLNHVPELVETARSFTMLQPEARVHDFMTGLREQMRTHHLADHWAKHGPYRGDYHTAHLFDEGSKVIDRFMWSFEDLLTRPHLERNWPAT